MRQAEWPGQRFRPLPGQPDRRSRTFRLPGGVAQVAQTLSQVRVVAADHRGVAVTHEHRDRYGIQHALQGSCAEGRAEGVQGILHSMLLGELLDVPPPLEDGFLMSFPASRVLSFFGCQPLELGWQEFQVLEFLTAQFVAHPLEAALDAGHTPGLTVAVAEERSRGVFSDETAGDLQGLLAQGHDPLHLLALGARDREDPTTVIRIEVAGLNGEEFVGTRSWLA